MCVWMFINARDTATNDEGTPIFLVSRETALFRQTILKSLDQEAWLYTLTLCSHQTCGGIQNPGFRIEPHACGWMVKTHACGCIHCLYFNRSYLSLQWRRFRVASGGGGGGRNRPSSFGHSSGERKLATVA